MITAIPLLLATLILVALTLRMRPAEIPERHLVAGDGYMRLWRDGDRIAFVFRNKPYHTIKFDVRVAEEMSERIKELA